APAGGRRPRGAGPRPAGHPRAGAHAGQHGPVVSRQVPVLGRSPLVVAGPRPPARLPLRELVLVGRPAPLPAPAARVPVLLDPPRPRPPLRRPHPRGDARGAGPDDGSAAQLSAPLSK